MMALTFAPRAARIFDHSIFLQCDKTATILFASLDRRGRTCKATSIQGFVGKARRNRRRASPKVYFALTAAKIVSAARARTAAVNAKKLCRFIKALQSRFRAGVHKIAVMPPQSRHFCNSFYCSPGPGVRYLLNGKRSRGGDRKDGGKK